MVTPLRVLMIEDSEDDALLLLRVLKKAGYDPQFERVDNGHAMQSALKRQRWDIVLADQSMPQFNATSALMMLKKSGADVPFIIVSGNIEENTAVAAMRLGAQDYIMKDNLTRLIPVIERELREAE